MPLITISQDYGSHGYFVAQKIAEELQLELYDDQTLREAAIQLGVKPENLNALKDQLPGFFAQLMGAKTGLYTDVLQEVVYQMASTNNGVIVGHGSQVLLKDFGCALHIRIISPAEKRVRYFMEKQGIEEGLAKELVKSKDSEAQTFLRHTFNMDINNPLLYDLVINTEKIGIETAISHIVELAQSNAISECSIDALNIMKCRSLEMKVHAALLQADIFMTGIKVEVTEPGKTFVHGAVGDYSERSRIIDVLGTISELNDAKVNIVVVPLNG